MDYGANGVLAEAGLLELETVDEASAVPGLFVPVVERFQFNARKAPNKRMHGVVYKTLGACFMGILTIWAITFRKSPFVIFNLAICFIYLAMYLGGPILFARTSGEGVSNDQPLRKFLKEPFDTNTGTITGKQAWIQVCIIPGALFFCTLGMGLIVAITV